MIENKEVLINNNIRPYLNEIAERLWSSPSHAAIMVGAGFSKNANKNFPDWATLGDLFFEKIHGRKPDKTNGEDRYLNALKLADEVQAAFGREVLNQLLRSHIPDNDSEPSSLHIQLLEFPWSDVFTTNYDTLLDRARGSVSEQKFDVVVNKDDLIYSEKPRIIKLHGSFPSERPFIITEEDYRTYPKKFAPFVNTVQQSLLENTLCLIGFSGDDPNFLQWIGWIRDNLGEESPPKIYLIGLFDLSDAQIKLLVKRNIVVVDLGECPDIGGDHQEALERFFNYLLSKKKDDNHLGWPDNYGKLSPDTSIDKTTQTEEIIKKWQYDRLHYPRWLIVPEDRRQNLWVSTKGWISFLSKNDCLSEELVLVFCYELNWRLEHCLYPIPDNVSEIFEKVVKNYWLFNEQKSSGHRVNGDSHYLNEKNNRNRCLSLGLSMLRFYREEGLFEQWEAINKKLNSLIESFSQEQVAYFYYERVLYALFKSDISQVKQQLITWPTNFSIPFWETKRAGLLAEIGQREEAERILDRSLGEIRSKLNLNPILSDYSLVSEEASTMLLLQYVRSPFDSNDRNPEEEKKIRRKFSNRFDVLRQYKCDPWNEIKLFENLLESSPVGLIDVSKKYEFDVGRITQTHHFINEDTETITAYNLLRFLENLGFPFRISGATLCKKSVKGTLQRISKYSPYWATATLIRSGDAKAADEIFNRQALLEYSPNKANRLIDEYLIILEGIDTEIANVNNKYGILLAQIIPETLSRLCCKCSQDRKLKLLGFLVNVYGSKYKYHYLGIKNLFTRLMATYTPVEQYQLIPRLLDITYPEGGGKSTIDEYVNPFSLIDYIEDSTIPTKKVELNQDRVIVLFDLAISDKGSKRKWAIFSLIRFFKLDLLSSKQIGELGNVLWSHIGSDNFPAATSHYKFAFLELPHPENIDPSTLMKNYIQGAKFPVQTGASMIGGHSPFCHEILGATQFLSWSQEEIKDLFERLVEWWDADKESLLDNSTKLLMGSVSEESKRNFSGLRRILIKVVFPNLQLTLDNKELEPTVERIINEIENYGISAVELKAVAFCYFKYDKKVLLAEIRNKLSSESSEEVIDGVQAILFIINAKKLETDKSFAKLLLLIGQMIHWNNQVALITCLKAIEHIIKEHPSYFTNELETMCLLGIKRLASRTYLDKDFTEDEFSKKLELRLVVASLAYQLSIFYTQKKFEIPTEVLMWKSICESEREFAEVKIQWEYHYLNEVKAD